GCTQAQAGGFLALFGAYNGINLDGGGSSALVKYVAPGVVNAVNVPSGGSQRLNGNNLAVFADALPVPTVPVLPYTPAIAANHPVAHYRFNETSDTTVADSSGNNRHGTFPASGVTKGVPDQPVKSETGTSATFNGAALTQVTVPYASAINAGSFTIEAWAKPTSSANAFVGVVSNRDDKGSGPAGNAGYILYLGPGTGDGGLPRWQFWTGGTTTATYTALGRNTATGFGLGPAATINAWQHVVGVFSASSGPDGTGRYNGTQTLYVNGVQVLTLANVNYLPNPNKPLYIGAGGNEGLTTDSNRFTGGIDEVAIYNTALSAAQIQAHYKSGTTILSAPSVALASPANNTVIPLGATINLIASASDTDGSVTKVEFFDGAAQLGEVTSAPFTYVWNGATAGPHSLTLIATDDSTLTTTSSAVAVTVAPPVPVVSTGTTTNVSSTTATLHGQVNPSGVA
ncbi:MAG: LamG-like jellyroll fold domain-containing protein, partial [Myxococcota bacterium]